MRNLKITRGVRFKEKTNIGATTPCNPPPTSRGLIILYSTYKLLYDNNDPKTGKKKDDTNNNILDYSILTVIIIIIFSHRYETDLQSSAIVQDFIGSNEYKW